MNEVKDYVERKLKNESSGHDIFHALRVFKNVEKLAIENCDIVLCKVSALVHDVIDPKVSKNVDRDKQELYDFISQKYNKVFADNVFEIICNMSYSLNKEKYFKGNINGQIVQDADRLEAIGAIGIARTFLYSGCNNLTIYDSINHFHDKLFEIVKLMNTEKGVMFAKERTSFMESFITQFNNEDEIYGV